MSILVNADGSLKTYVVGDIRTETILAAFNWAGEATSGKDKLKAARGPKGGAEFLELFNITHPKCPDWLQDLVRSDSVYCSRKAEGLDARASALRKKAADLLAEAEGYEARAAEWRELGEAASGPRGPGI